MDKEKNMKTLMDCRYCPMCKQVCTSGNLTKHESDFPRGRALILYSIFKGTGQYDSDIVNSIYNCFLCGCCMANCMGEQYSIPDLVKSSRQDIVGLNKEPAACRSLKESIIKNDNPYGLPETDSFKYKAKQKAEVLYYMGLEVNYKNNEIAEAVIKVLKSAKVDFTMLEREPDCGKILSLLGYESDAKVKAKKLYEMIKKSGCKALITSCPLCYDAFKNDYPEWGLALEPEVKVYHISEYVHELANTGKLKIKKTDKKVTLADSEYLSIFNDLMKEPRELLKLSADGNLIDLAKAKESVLATGEAAFLIDGKKFDMGEEINKSNCERAKQSGADIIVTLSATAKNNIEKCSDLKVMDIAEFVGGLI